ncbi:MAG: cyclic nucleotide-binding domain-containing protein [Candidatus Calescibacterium sp.]|nr:cyclic nucleotide-binding domain-containing protein [Candidatus Calescibacterium sp.]MDW8133126.1 cyclic nucleotide-binding domain-containing protein [Candidatus Calescibacterium sp.]
MIEDYIKNHTFFHNWKQEYIDKIVDISSLETYPKNHRIISEGFYADKFYIIIAGLVEIKSMDIVLQMLGPGEVIGWSWLVPPYTWNFSVDTIKETIVVSINSEKLKKIFESNREIECLIYKSMFFVVSNRLKISRQKIVELCISK